MTHSELRALCEKRHWDARDSIAGRDALPALLDECERLRAALGEACDLYEHKELTRSGVRLSQDARISELRRAHLDER